MPIADPTEALRTVGLEDRGNPQAVIIAKVIFTFARGGELNASRFTCRFFALSDKLESSFRVGGLHANPQISNWAECAT